MHYELNMQPGSIDMHLRTAAIAGQYKSRKHPTQATSLLLVGAVFGAIVGVTYWFSTAEADSAKDALIAIQSRIPGLQWY